MLPAWAWGLVAVVVSVLSTAAVVVAKGQKVMKEMEEALLASAEVVKDFREGSAPDSPEGRRFSPEEAQKLGESAQKFWKEWGDVVDAVRGKI